MQITFFVLFKYLSFAVDTDESKGQSNSLEDSFKPLQVGITNPTPSQQAGSISPPIPSTTIADNGQRTSRPPSSNEQRDGSPKALLSPDTATTGPHFDTSSSPTSKINPSLQNLQNAVPIGPAPVSSTTRDYEQGLSIVFSRSLIPFGNSIWLFF